MPNRDTTSTPRTPDNRRNARRQFGAALNIISGAQARVQKPSGRSQAYGGVQSRDEEPLPHRPGGDAARDRHRAHIPLAGRLTCDEQPQEAHGSQSSREQNPATGKRGRSDQSEQQPRKKTRVEPTNKYTSTSEQEREENVSEPVAQTGGAQKANTAPDRLTIMTEEDRRALRARKFAPHIHPPKDTAVSSDRSMEETKQYQERKGGREATLKRKQTENITKTLAVAAKSNAAIKANPPAGRVKNGDRMPRRETYREPAHEAATNAKRPTERPVPTTKKPYHTPPTLPNSVSSEDKPSSAKRPLVEVDGHEEHPHKKLRLKTVDHRLSDSRQTRIVLRPDAKTMSTPTPNTERSTPQLHSFSKQKLRTPLVVIDDEREPIVELFPEDKLDFFEYGNDSVPIMYSTSIEHNDSAELSTEPSIYLRQDALAYSGRGNGHPRTLDVLTWPRLDPRIINDCDMYFRNGKIHVSTERGLLLAADYFKLIGIPDTQPVRFEGHKPAWTKTVGAKRHYRRVEVPCMVSEDKKSQGLLELLSGSTVMVLERDTEHFEGKDIELAYGMRLDNGAKGWFPFEITCPMNWRTDASSARETHDSFGEEIIDWSKYSYARLAAFAAAAALETSQGQDMPKSALESTVPPTTPNGTALPPPTALASPTTPAPLTMPMPATAPLTMPMPATAPAPPTTPASLTGISAPTTSAPVTTLGTSAIISEEGPAAEVSVMETSQKKQDTQPEHKVDGAPVTTADAPMRHQTYVPEAQPWQMLSVAAGPMSISTEAHKHTVADREQEVKVPEPPKEQENVDEEPSEGRRNNSLKHARKDQTTEIIAKGEVVIAASTMSSSQDTGRPQHEHEEDVAAKKGELVAKNEIIITSETVAAPALLPAQNIQVQRKDRYPEEDEVDWSDNEL